MIIVYGMERDGAFMLLGGVVNKGRKIIWMGREKLRRDFDEKYEGIYYG